MDAPTLTPLEQTQAQLAEVQAAISRALVAQSDQVSSSTGGRRTDRASLESLTARETLLLQRVARLQRGRGLATLLAVPR